MNLILFRKYADSISKTILTVGLESRKPSDGSVCSIEFECVSSTAKLNSSYLAHSSATITIGFADRILDHLVDYCIRTMLVQEQSQFSMQLSDTTYEFVMTLSECFFKPYVFLMSDVEKLCLARNFKEQGTALYESNKIEEAFNKFRRALQYVLVMNFHYPSRKDSNSYCLSAEDSRNTKQLLINVFNNIALCHLKLNNFDQVISICFKSLAVEPNAKAFYRRALAYINNLAYENAEEDLLNALELDKTNTSVLQKLNLVRELQKPNEENYKQTVKKMFL